MLRDVCPSHKGRELEVHSKSARDPTSLQLPLLKRILARRPTVFTQNGEFMYMERAKPGCFIDK